MKQIFKYDSEGNWLPGETILILPDENEQYTIPEQYTDIPLPQPNWKPVFRDGRWAETITQEEIEDLNPPSIPTPSNQERIEELENMVNLLIMGVF